MQRVRVSSQQSPVHKLGDSQMSLSPKFRLAMSTPAATAAVVPHHRHPLSSESELSQRHGPLIPGLPDDIALNCLLRLPVESHPSCRSVCRRWHLLLGSKERFFSRRKALDLRDPWLFVFAFHRCTGKVQWQVLDLTRLSWHTIPTMPCRDKVCPRGFGCVALPNQGTLLVCGGMVSDMDCPLDLVLKYELHRNRWTVMSRMLTPRSFFASAAIDGMVYAAGGSGTDLFELSSAEILDPTTGKWQPISDMGTNMASYDAAVLEGKLLVTEGWMWPFLFSPRGQVYDPKSNSWEPMTAALREGWTGSSTVLYGHLFVISEHEMMRVKVYDMESDSWETVFGSPVPERIRKPFSVSSTTDGRIYVVGRDLHVVVGHVRQTTRCTDSTDRNSSASAAAEGKKGRKWSFSVNWQEIDAPQSFSDLTPSTTQILFG